MVTLEKMCDRGCGLTIFFKGKIPGKRNSTGYFESKNPKIEHTFKRCDVLIEQKRIMDNVKDTQDIRFFLAGGDTKKE